jgi:hypothetical protein
MKTYIGLISETTKTGVTIKFLEGLKKHILIKDLDNA